MIKIALIGAGSVVFSKNLTGDILSFPEFKNATMTYMDIDADRLEVGGNICRKVAKTLGATPKIETTMDRRAALQGADFVINMVQIGGFDSTLVDFEIPRKYGLNFTIADTTGPAGVFRALRTYPMLSGMCRDMMELCPRATLLNYSNPMSMNMQTITRTSSIRSVGLCHSVQGTFNQLMGYVGEDPAAASFICAGINHMAFYLKLEKDGVDLYPRLFQAMDKPNLYNGNRVRFELMRRLGYFVTESSEHNAEYCPYFIPHGKAQINEFMVPIDDYLGRCDANIEEYERLKIVGKTDESLPVIRSHEYGSTIIHSMVTGKPSVVYGNMPNRGAIANLPPTAIAEVPTLVDRAGLQFTTVGELPPQLVGYIQPHVIQHELFIRAALEGRRDHIYQAAMFDPLTASTLKLDQIVEMCDELIAAHGNLLPNLDSKKSLVPASGKQFSTVDPKILRRSWEQAKAKKVEDFIFNWHVLGAFPSPTPGKVSLDQPTGFEDDYLKRGDGAVDLKAAWKSGEQTVRWTAATANKKGFVSLTDTLGKIEWAVGYAYTQIESTHARDTVLSFGSDDGIRIWLNGTRIFSREIPRGFSPGSDTVAVHLKAGINQLLIKIDNYEAGWGFGIEVPKANS